MLLRTSSRSLMDRLWSGRGTPRQGQRTATAAGGLCPWRPMTRTARAGTRSGTPLWNNLVSENRGLSWVCGWTASARSEGSCWLRWRGLPRSQTPEQHRANLGNEHPGRLRRRPAAACWPICSWMPTTSSSPSCIRSSRKQGERGLPLLTARGRPANCRPMRRTTPRRSWPSGRRMRRWPC